MNGRVCRPLLLVVLLASLLPAFGLSAAADSRPRVLMLGDSLTAGFNWSARLPQALVENQGISGDTTGHILARLDRTIAAEPELIFLQAGINDFGLRDKDTVILDNHLAIWRELRSELPGLRLVLISLLPVAEARSPGLNTQIIEFNRRLRNEAEKEGLTFIDLFPLLANGTGQLPRKFTYDGLHLNAAGYEIWLEALQPHLQGGGQ